MIAPLSPETIAACFVGACEAELEALKPGNVHDHAGGHRMDAAMFRAAAKAAAPAIADRSLSCGERIEAAVKASVAVTGCNTNLGIVLLCAPLACAAEDGGAPLRFNLDTVLDRLTVADAKATYRAIAVASPAGLGRADLHDVKDEPTVTLLHAMVAARHSDRIAAQYATDFADIYDFALPALATARLSARSATLAVTTLHMCLLAQFPDTHITRKFGKPMAQRVLFEANRLRPSYLPAVDDEGFKRLLDFDADLKARGLNPGTTADLVVATLFADRLNAEIRAAKSH